MPTSFLWYDYETSGTDFRRDRIMQFGALRTDEMLEPIGEPICLYCKPLHDFLPHPGACLLTGITPQKAEREGVPEFRFAEHLLREFSLPGTCATGYNSLAFDRHFTRHLLYRNLYDPYAHEWRDGNSSWDLLDVMRMCRALRPEGIEWPDHASGKADFRLESLVQANRINTGRSHDALVDARAVLELARLLQRQQPKLFEYALRLRKREYAEKQLPADGRTPVLHVSSQYGNDRYCTALVLPLGRIPGRRWSVAVFDLAQDARALLDHVPEENGTQRGLPGVYLLHLNHCPVFAPARMVDSAVAGRLHVDLEHCQQQLRLLSDARGLQQKVEQAWPDLPRSPPEDPELSLYEGPFLSDTDRALSDKVHEMPPEQLASAQFDFADMRLAELLLRWRARNFPDTLRAEEIAQWEDYRYRRLTEAEGGGGIILEDYLSSINRFLSGEEFAIDSKQRVLLNELQEWADQLTC